MEEHPENLHPELSDVDSIQNLDTARMALRWALERLRALDHLGKENEIVRARALQLEIFSARLEQWLLSQLSETPAPEALESLRVRENSAKAQLQNVRERLKRGNPQDFKEALKSLAELERRMAHWETALARKAGLDQARGELRSSLGGLQEDLIRTEEDGAEEISLEERPAASSGKEASAVDETLVKRFKEMLESWDSWEATRRKALESQRQQQRDQLLQEMGGGNPEAPEMERLLKNARERTQELAAQGQAEAVAEFRRMLLSWEAEHAARRRLQEQALDAAKKELDRRIESLKAGMPGVSLDAITTLEKRLRDQEDQYARRLARQKEEFDRALQAREIERKEAEHRHEESLRVRLSEAQLRHETALADEREHWRRIIDSKNGEHEELQRRLEAQEKEYEQGLERQKTSFEAALRENEQKTTEAVQIFKDEVETLKAGWIAPYQAEIQGLKQRLEEKASGPVEADQAAQAELLAKEREAHRRTLAELSALEEKLAQPNGREAELEAALRERDVKILQIETESLNRLEALKAASTEAAKAELEGLQRELADEKKKHDELNAKIAAMETESLNRLEALKTAAGEASQAELAALQKQVAEEKEKYEKLSAARVESKESLEPELRVLRLGMEKQEKDYHAALTKHKEEAQRTLQEAEKNYLAGLARQEEEFRTITARILKICSSLKDELEAS